MLTGSKSFANRGRAIAMVSVAVGVAIGGALYLLQPWSNSGGELRDVPPIGGNRAIPLISDDAPLHRGEQVSLQDAEKRAGFELIRPDDASRGAADSSITEVWVSTEGQPTVAIRYESGLTAVLTAWSETGTNAPGSFYATLVEEAGVGSVEWINGNPAFVVAADAQAPGFPRSNTVIFTAGLVEVSLTASSSLDDLRMIAASAAT